MKILFTGTYHNWVPNRQANNVIKQNKTEQKKKKQHLRKLNSKLLF